MDDEDHKLSDYYIDSLDKFKINSVGNDDRFNELPIDTLLKFSYTIISSRLVIKKDSKLILESYLEECFYERIYKMGPNSLKIKNGSYYFWNDMIYLDKFNDKTLKVNKREIRESNNIYYISCVMNKPEHNIDSVNNLYFIVHNLYGAIEKINGSRDRYLVIDKGNNINKKNIDVFNKLWAAIISKIKYLRNNAIFDDNVIKITDWNKIKFNSGEIMPTDTLINFHSLTIVLTHVIEKNGEFIPEIYVDEGIYEKV